MEELWKQNFTPLAILLPYFMEKTQKGTGINGILLAAPIADFVAAAVILVLTISFFRELSKETTASETEQLIIHPSCQGTIITIAREHGTAGKQIGKLSEKIICPIE